MAIRINLLAEARAAEEMRRRNPVRRALWIGGFVVVVVLVWSSSLQVKIISSREKLNSLEAEWSSKTNAYEQVIATQRQLAETEQKLGALERLATNRFLWANVLNQLQQTTVEDVELLQLKGEQIYLLSEEVKPRTNEFNAVIPGKPATVTERIVLYLKAKDISQNPGDQVARYKEAIASSPYFQTMLGKTNEVRLANLSAPQIDPQTGRPSVVFTLECRFAEKVR